MSKLELLMREADTLSDTELVQLLAHLRSRQRTAGESAPPAPEATPEEAEPRIDLSRTAFGQDWDSPEEDEAWRDL